MYRCPKCNSPDNLLITISVDVRLIQPEDNPDEFSTEIVDGDHEWDDDSGR